LRAGFAAAVSALRVAADFAVRAFFFGFAAEPNESARATGLAAVGGGVWPARGAAMSADAKTMRTVDDCTALARRERNRDIARNFRTT
jgi:hypothetical protein